MISITWHIYAVQYSVSFTGITLMLLSDKLAARRTPGPHCCFDGIICTTAQAPLATEGRPSGKQPQAKEINNLAPLPKAAVCRQLTSIQLGSNTTQ